jgi:hypothetical protein
MTRRWDQREKELLDRLMFATNKPWNLPPHREVPNEPEEDEQQEEGWRNY